MVRNFPDYRKLPLCRCATQYFEMSVRFDTAVACNLLLAVLMEIQACPSRIWELWGGLTSQLGQLGIGGFYLVGNAKVL